MIRSRFTSLAAIAALLATFLLAGCGSMRPGGGDTEPVVESTDLTGNVSDPRNRAKVHTELASLYYGRGNMAVALEELRTASAADPSYPLTYSIFGLVYMELREYHLAQTNFERGLQLSPTDPDINHNYGWFLCQTGHEAESIKYFQQAVRNPLYPAPWRSYSAAGICSMRKDNLKAAEGFFLLALRQAPDDPPALLQLGQIRYRQGNMDEARKLVGRYNKVVEPTAESLWLAVRVEHKLGERSIEADYANRLRRRFSGSREYQLLQRGEYD